MQLCSVARSALLLIQQWRNADVQCLLLAAATTMRAQFSGDTTVPSCDGSSPLLFCDVCYVSMNLGLPAFGQVQGNAGKAWCAMPAPCCRYHVSSILR